MDKVSMEPPAEWQGQPATGIHGNSVACQLAAATVAGVASGFMRRHVKLKGVMWCYVNTRPEGCVELCMEAAVSE